MTAPSTRQVGGTTRTVMPARSWPVYELGRARAEIVAMDMLLRGVSRTRIRHSTKLSLFSIARLADLIAEEADQPPMPRNVCRNPIRHSHATSRQKPRIPTPVQDLTEPLQMALALD
ncbi:hypothetical protein QMK19_23250 [Streptomyces sp. H10-C2]|uniref:hypothetical protein n=1 Tax=unclassified Streptomyces TaxID=2593676 RepID=UPI0024B8CC62|nr:MULTISPECIES: hypothetical protein [unclassified Streptomyces]MDJ0342824.1 hypothetical protein [Streptomyces sp. PH10-H1]MDJ0372502.1 hypothetical protein [Streptomyces sp. H10-C2]